MSTHADVTVVLTEPDKQHCSFKCSYLPVGIYKDKHYRSNEPNWFIAAPGYYFRDGDVMIFLWYDGISCFIQVKGNFTVKIGDFIQRKKHKINIKHGDIIRIRDSWKVMEKEICLKFEIYCNGEQMNVDQSNNFTDSREQILAHKRAPQNQIPTFQPTPNRGNLWQWSEHTSTVQKLELRNSTVNTTPLENLRLQRDTVKCIPPGQVAKMKNVYEPNGPVESRKEQHILVRKTKASPQYRLLINYKTDLRFPCSRDQNHDFMQKGKNRTTNLRVKLHASQSDSLSVASNVSGNEMREHYGVTNHRNTPKGIKSQASQSGSLSFASNVSGNEMREHDRVTNHRNTSQGVKLHASQSDSLSVASNVSGNQMREHYGVTNHRNTPKGIKSHASQSGSLSFASNVSGNEMREHDRVTNHRNTSQGVKLHASQRDSLSAASNDSGNDMREHYGVPNHRNKSNVENITAHQNVSLPLSSQRCDDDDKPDKYCELDQDNTQHGVKLHCSQIGSLSFASNVSDNEMREHDGVTNHRNTPKVENITTHQHVSLPLSSQRCDDDDKPDNYCEIDQDNTQQEKPMKGVPNMGMTCYANSIFQILAQTQLFLSAIIPGEDMVIFNQR